MKEKRKISYYKKKLLYGYGFISLWLVGTVVFFIVPLVKSFVYSFSEVTIDSGKTITKWVGFDKYIKVLTQDEKYTKLLKTKNYYIIYFYLKITETIKHFIKR